MSLGSVYVGVIIGPVARDGPCAEGYRPLHSGMVWVIDQ